MEIVGTSNRAGRKTRIRYRKSRKLAAAPYKTAIGKTKI
jgi:hypothetical protein